jgi:hypothetical protein
MMHMATKIPKCVEQLKISGEIFNIELSLCFPQCTQG